MLKENAFFFTRNTTLISAPSNSSSAALSYRLHPKYFTCWVLGKSKVDADGLEAQFTIFIGNRASSFCVFIYASDESGGSIHRRFLFAVNGGGRTEGRWANVFLPLWRRHAKMDPFVLSCMFCGVLIEGWQWQKRAESRTRSVYLIKFEFASEIILFCERDPE